MRLPALLLAALLPWIALGDTFTHIETGEKLEGRVLGTMVESGVTKYIVKIGRDHRMLAEKDWHRKVAPQAQDPADTFQWKPMILDGQVRDVAWLKRTYRSVRRRFTMLCGSVLDVTIPAIRNEHPYRSVSGREDYPGRIYVSGLVSELIGTTGIVVLAEMSLGRRQVRAIPLTILHLEDNAGILVGKPWSGTVAYVFHKYGRHTPKPTTPEERLELRLSRFYVPFPAKPEPLTPEQFVWMIEHNHTLLDSFSDNR